MEDPLSVFQELGDPTRLRVLACIARGRKNVSTIVAELGLSQPQVSYHLRRLKDAGLAVEEKEGRWVWYQANHDAPERHLRELIDYVARWTPETEGATGGAPGSGKGPGGTDAGVPVDERADAGRPFVRRPDRDDDMEDYLL